VHLQDNQYTSDLLACVLAALVLFTDKVCFVTITSLGRALGTRDRHERHPDIVTSKALFMQNKHFNSKVPACRLTVAPAFQQLGAVLHTLECCTVHRQWQHQTAQHDPHNNIAYIHATTDPAGVLACRCQQVHTTQPSAVA
jgi:hypothetical protein